MSDDKNPLVQVRHLKKYFPIYAGAIIQRHVGDIKAVDDISFDIYKGELSKTLIFREKDLTWIQAK